MAPVARSARFTKRVTRKVALCIEVLRQIRILSLMLSSFHATWNQLNAKGFVRQLSLCLIVRDELSTQTQQMSLL